MSKATTALSLDQQDEILKILKARFEDNMGRHTGIAWGDVHDKLATSTDKLRALFQMEATGGEPDVVSYDNKVDVYTFVDCSAESPKGRRNVCYDREALENRKANKPHNNAIDMASEIGIELLSAEQYQELQKSGEFDTKTSSWVRTPDNIRKLGGALFCDRRYDSVFIYHNGADSYYSSRGFRGSLTV